MLEERDEGRVPDEVIIGDEEDTEDVDREAFEAGSGEIIDVEPERESGPDMDALREAFRALPTLPEGAASADPLTLYLARLRHLPLLDASDQQKLAVLYKEDGDIEAAKLLVLSNLRLVVKIAREYQRRWTNLLELVQEGNVGLSEAIKRYDPYRNVRFTSYAQYWIRAMILNYLMNHFQPVRIGSTRAGRKLFYNLKKVRAKLVRDGHHNPTPAQIAEELGVDEKDVIQVSRHLDVPPVSLDETAPGFEDTTFGDLLSDREAPSPEQTVAGMEFQRKLREAMDAFAEMLDEERDRALWFDRMTADEPVTLAELGDRFGVSKERIRQLEVRLKKRFKTFVQGKLGPTLELIFD